MKQALLLSCCFLLVGILQAQSLSYKRFFPLRMGDKPEVSGLDVQQTYRLSDNELIVIGHPVQPDKEQGQHLAYLKRNSPDLPYQELFRSKGVNSSIYNPSFFRTGDASILVICSAGSGETARSETIFLLENGIFKEVGTLDLVVESEGKYLSIVPYLKISKENSGEIIFKTDAGLVLNGNASDKKHSGIEYIYQDGLFKERK